jgi:Tol biopolymer transport system component
VAVSIPGDAEDIWVYDLSRGTLDRITSQGSSGGPIWTPDGKRIVYERRPQAGAAVASVAADGSDTPTILATHDKGPIAPSSVSPDGKIVLGFYPLERGFWVLPLQDGADDRKPQPYLDSRFTGFNPAFSPDGHWIAYSSDETGRREIYVSPYPGPGARFPISVDGGGVPRWSHDGRELFYRKGQQMMAVAIQTSPVFRAEKPVVLFEGPYGNNFDVARDGRFLMIKPPNVQQTPTNQVNVVLNWLEELKQRVPTR